jgi:flavodoxin
MNSCVVYFSRTGNTKRLAQAIADATKATLFEMATTQPSALASFDLVILGTPVEGSSPTKETSAFIDAMPSVEGKKAILFVTYRIFGNERAMKTMEKTLKTKGYEFVLKVSKKGMKPNMEADFTEALTKIKTALQI